jgi:glutathione synthetase
MLKNPHSTHIPHKYDGRHPDLDEPSSRSSTSSIASTSLPNRIPSASPLGVTLFPTVFPRRLFASALAEQTKWNALYARVICNEAWIEEVMRDVVAEDELASVLWGVHVKARGSRQLREEKAGKKEERAELGIWRCDWMIDGGKEAGVGTEERGGSGEADDLELALKQVEFNTIACAGACHGKRVADIHRLFADMGIYDIPSAVPMPLHGVRELPSASRQSGIYTSAKLPPNDTPTNIVAALTSAFNHYAESLYPPANPQPKLPLCIILPVQPFNINPFDELPIVNSLITNNRIPTFRIEFPLAFIATTKLDIDTGILTFTPTLPGNVTYEVAVIYLRCGHEMHEYEVHSGLGIGARVRMESSRAILCPTVLGQLAGSKAIQAALAQPRNLRRFVDEEVAMELVRGCVEMYSLASDEGKTLVEQILGDEDVADEWVLKPACAEGGGHNFFGKDVVDILRRLRSSDNDGDELAGYVLMKRIEAPLGVSNILALATGEVYSRDVIAELGIWGTCLFRKGQGETAISTAEILSNEVAGWSVRTKKAAVDEMSVVKGYGVFDSVVLIDDEQFAKRAEENVEHHASDDGNDD